MTKTVTLKELRPKLPEIMDAVEERMDRYVITRHGHPAAVLMSPEDLEGLLETLEILQDKALMRRLRKAKREFRQGKGIPLEEVHRKLGVV